MALGARYFPPHPAGESCIFGLDFSPILPLGVCIQSGSLSILTNTVPPGPAPGWTIGPIQIEGRRVYCPLTGGTEGVDYQLQWSVTDTQGNTWPRTCLVLCAQTN